MGRLFSMNPSWFDMSEDERIIFLRRYRAKRDNDLLEPSPLGKKRTDRKTLSDKIAEVLSPEEIALAEKLGLSKRALKGSLNI